MAKRIFTRRCEHCYTYYEAKRPSSKYCSDGCRVMAYKKRHGIPLPDFANLSAIQSKFQTPEVIKVRDLSNQLLVLASRRRSAEAEYERYRKKFEEADAELRRLIEAVNDPKQYIYTHSDVRRQEERREALVPTLNTAGDRLSEIDREATKLQEQLATAEQRLAMKGIEKKREVISSKDLRTKTFDVLPIGDVWDEFLGRPERGFLLLVYGTPFSGKSSLCLRLLDYLTRFGSCAYVSAEEGISESFRRKLTQYTQNEFTITGERIPAGIKKTVSKHDFVVIDSVQAATLSVADLESMVGKKTSVVAILQSTKAGEYRGGADYIHLADIVWAISIDDGIQHINVEKNRFL